MATLAFHDVHFGYESAPDTVFDGLSILLDGSWRTAVVGCNGQGKTTLLKLAAGLLEPQAGRIERLAGSRYFPAPVAAAGLTTRQVVKAAVAPFERWEWRMAALLEDGGEPALGQYADLHDRFVARGGYRIDADIAREFDALGLPEALLERPFESLSGGERSRALIASLFLGEDAFPLIDEPTNHLDAEGRARLMGYLAGRQGFLLVSHDRHFLDGAVDHVLSLNRSDVRVNRGNYTSWRAQMDDELAHETRTRRRIERDIARLQMAARDSRSHAISREGDKYRPGAVDKGFIGSRAARQMKRARSVERRIEGELEEKSALLENQEKARTLKVVTGRRGREVRLAVQNLCLAVGGRTLFAPLSFSIGAGERVAITGPNGCGKTSLLEALCGAPLVASGLVRCPGYVTLSRCHQRPRWRSGKLSRRLVDEGLDEAAFRQLLGVLGVEGRGVERDLSTLSQGELKKIELCRSLSVEADVLLWDEPLNYLDVAAREQLEIALLEGGATVLFVEHDRRFIDNVATRVIELSAATGREAQSR
jgi:lincosamide and streptogramin A transport system ATP-binding/permease protein